MVLIYDLVPPTSNALFFIYSTELQPISTASDKGQLEDFCSTFAVIVDESTPFINLCGVDTYPLSMIDLLPVKSDVKRKDDLNESLL